MILPVELAAIYADDPGFVFLDAALEDRFAGNFSLLAHHPHESIQGSNWQVLGGFLGKWLPQVPDTETSRTSKWHHPAEKGALIGFIEYDGAYQFAWYPEVGIFDHVRNVWLRWPAWADRTFLQSPPIPASPLDETAISFHPEISREQYCAMVQRAQDYICAGDIYQVNLTHRLSGKISASGFPFYQRLRTISPVPYGAYLNFGERQVYSASPECFLRYEGQEMMTRPIKGTRPRGKTPEEDARFAQELKSSAKEAAELTMITDLERNDLGQVAEFGSVQVKELLHLETFAQVFHQVSTVTGKRRADISVLEMLRACFPGGSITGAPKKRAREIIAELESVPRGLYTGAIGYFGQNGGQFSIAIRTVIRDGSKIHFHVGSGIVADSLPEAEYEETLAKAAGILQAAMGTPTSPSAFLL